MCLRTETLGKQSHVISCYLLLLLLGFFLPAWIGGFISISVISFLSLLGVILVPLMNRVFFKFLLSFLVALAVGTLSGDAFLHLLPHVSINYCFIHYLQAENLTAVCISALLVRTHLMSHFWTLLCRLFGRKVFHLEHLYYSFHSLKKFKSFMALFPSLFPVLGHMCCQVPLLFLEHKNFAWIFLVVYCSAAPFFPPV